MGYASGFQNYTDNTTTLSILAFALRACEYLVKNFVELVGLSADLHGKQFRSATRVLDGLDSVFGREFPHYQGQFAVGCGLDRSPINPLYVFSGSSAHTVHSDNKFGVCHLSIAILLREPR